MPRAMCSSTPSTECGCVQIDLLQSILLQAKRFMEMMFMQHRPTEASHLASLILFFCNPNKLLQWEYFGYS